MSEHRDYGDETDHPDKDKPFPSVFICPSSGCRGTLDMYLFCSECGKTATLKELGI